MNARGRAPALSREREREREREKERKRDRETRNGCTGCNGVVKGQKEKSSGRHLHPRDVGR